MTNPLVTGSPCPPWRPGIGDQVSLRERERTYGGDAHAPRKEKPCRHPASPDDDTKKG